MEIQPGYLTPEGAAIINEMIREYLAFGFRVETASHPLTVHQAGRLQGQIIGIDPKALTAGAGEITTANTDGSEESATTRLDFDPDTGVEVAADPLWTGRSIVSMRPSSPTQTGVVTAAQNPLHPAPQEFDPGKVFQHSVDLSHRILNGYGGNTTGSDIVSYPILFRTGGINTPASPAITIVTGGSGVFGPFQRISGSPSTILYTGSQFVREVWAEGLAGKGFYEDAVAYDSVADVAVARTRWRAGYSSGGVEMFAGSDGHKDANGIAFSQRAHGSSAPTANRVWDLYARPSEAVYGGLSPTLEFKYRYPIYVQQTFVAGSSGGLFAADDADGRHLGGSANVEIDGTRLVFRKGLFIRSEATTVPVVPVPPSPPAVPTVPVPPAPAPTITATVTVSETGVGPIQGRQVTCADATNSPQLTDASGQCTLTGIPAVASGTTDITLNGSGETVKYRIGATGSSGDSTGTGYTATARTDTGDLTVLFEVDDPNDTFAANYTVSGAVTDLAGTGAVVGRTLTCVNDSTTATTTTDGSGGYTFGSLAAGATSVTVTLIDPESGEEHNLNSAGWVSGATASFTLAANSDLDFRIDGVETVSPLPPPPP